MLDMSGVSMSGLPIRLDTAFRPGAPGPPLPPGPVDNPWTTRAGAAAVPIPADWQAVFDALWRPHGFHVTEDGRTTGVARRPVPSAGATYGVRTHLTIPRDCVHASLPPGRYAYLLGSGTLVQRVDGGPPPRGTRPTLTFTVQPGRAFGRYRHRAWLLWIADTAYTVALAQWLLGRHHLEVGPFPDIGRIGLPRASDVFGWDRLGLAPELVLAHLRLPASPTLHPGYTAVLAKRRAPSLAEFSCNAGTPPPSPAIAAVARASGQEWVRGAGRVVSWTTPSSRTTITDLWRIHLVAAHAFARAVLHDHTRVRPVSGLTAPAPPDVIHALAFLDTPAEPTGDLL